jgi:cytochrome c peroxidase
MRGWPLLLVLAACHREPAPVARPTPFTPKVPSYVLPMPVPADNPLTVEGVELGRRLFYDRLLSRDGSLSCSSCHQQAHGFADPRPVSIGVEGQAGRRNAMPLFNLAWEPAFFWDGRAATIEEQVMVPLQAPDEMARDVDLLIADLQKAPDYVARFDAAFPGQGVTPTTIARALAQFVRSIVSFSAPWDVTDEAAWTKEGGPATRGHHLLSHPYPDVPGASMLPCNGCHAGDRGVDPESELKHRPGLFSAGGFRNNGLDDPRDLGRLEVTKDPKDRALFRVPSVRNLGLTAPYFHDGRFADLRDVVRHYAAGVHASDTLDPLLTKDGAPLRIPLKDADVEDMLVFLQLLDDPSLATNPAWSDPFAAEARR